MSEDMPERMPEEMPEDMPEDMLEWMPERMSEDMSERTQWSPPGLNQDKGRGGEDNSDEIWRLKGSRFH